MPEAKINVLREAPDLKQLADEVARLQKLLRWLLNGQIDFENIRARSIKGENIEAETITTTELAADSVTADKIAAGSVTTDKLDAGAVTADKIDAGAVTTSKLAAGAVTADKIDVDELSAITADLGHITAGLIEAVQIFGSYIATANGTYPRAELSSTDNLFRAATSANKRIDIVPSLNSPVVPGLLFTDDDLGLNALVYMSSSGLFFLGASATDIYINSALGKVMMNWSNIQHVVTGRTLQQDLDGKQDVISGATGAFETADNKTVIVTNGIVTNII